MSVDATLSILAEHLTGIVADARAFDSPDEPRQALNRIYRDPAESLNIADFPALILSQSVGRDHVWREEALGLARHDYYVTGYLAVGARDLTPLPLLHSRALRWSEPLARRLMSSLTLDNRVTFIGDGDAGNTLFTYQLRPFDWGEGKFFGLVWHMGVTEKIIMEMDR